MPLGGEGCRKWCLPSRRPTRSPCRVSILLSSLPPSPPLPVLHFEFLFYLGLFDFTPEITRTRVITTLFALRVFCAKFIADILYPEYLVNRLSYVSPTARFVSSSIPFLSLSLSFSLSVSLFHPFDLPVTPPLSLSLSLIPLLTRDSYNKESQRHGTAH